MVRLLQAEGRGAPRFGRAREPTAVPLEIERKFLVADDGWRMSVVRSERLIDGLLATSKGRKVRVRLFPDRATLAIKTRKKGRVRFEFEYASPREDARLLLKTQCGRDIVCKTRHDSPHADFTWEVDVYEDVLEGVVIAEVELSEDGQDPPRPPWVGREVTDDPLFRKSQLFNMRRPKRVLRKTRMAA